MTKSSFLIHCVRFILRQTGFQCLSTVHGENIHYLSMLCLFTFGGLVTNPTISLISSDVVLHPQVIIISAADNRSVLTSEKSGTDFRKSSYFGTAVVSR